MRPSLACRFGSAAIVAISLASGPAQALETAEEIEACLQGNLPDDTSIQTIRLTSADRVGDTTQLHAKMYWAKDKDARSQVLLKFDAPADIRGTSLLMLEKEGRNEIFTYLPALQRARRVNTQSMNGSLFGTDFSYEEFERMQGMADDAATGRAPDSVVNERPTYVLEHTPATDSGSSYALVRSYVDRETCVPIRVEFIGPEDRLDKQLDADFSKVSKEPSGYVPREVIMRNLLDGTQTTLAVEELEIGAKISRKKFSLANLERGR